MSPINYILLILYFSLSICYSFEEKKQYMKNLYGENKEITGEYDKDLSITCNNGIFVGKKNGNILSFKGVPYAKPPIGELRWKEPVLAEDNSKIYEAYYYGKSPIQNEMNEQLGSFYPQSEDCLYLNIWLNTKDSSKGKTVMVFIHGGGFNSGATSDPAYDGYNLINKYEDVIYISIGYRLNILGFINLSSVSGGENYKSSTNLGLLDQICALKWIQKNIEKFGGDPKKVTVFGQSAGASSASLLPLINGSENLFQRIISESGPMSLSFSLEESQKSTEELIKKSGASNMEDLMALSEDEIKKIHSEISSYDCFPIRDGNILPVDLYEGYKSGKGKEIDMLLGSNKDEIRYFILSMGEFTNYYKGKFLFTHGLPILYENYYKKLSSEDKEKVKEFMNLQNDKRIWKVTEFLNEIIFRVSMNKQAGYHSDAGGNTYVYIWKFPGKDETLGAYHAIELPYVFNNDFDGDKILNEELVNNTQDIWVNFARNGNPSTKELTWEKYDSESRKTMIIDKKIEMGEEYKKEQRELLDPILKYYFNGVTAQMSYNVPQTYRIVAQILATLGIIVIVFGVVVKRF